MSDLGYGFGGGPGDLAQFLLEENKRLKAEIEQLRAERPDREGWQPIETAPKDATRVLVCDTMGYVFIAQYGNEYGAKCWLDETYDCPDFDLKSWRPLPAPPANHKQE